MHERGVCGPCTLNCLVPQNTDASKSKKTCGSLAVVGSGKSTDTQAYTELDFSPVLFSFHRKKNTHRDHAAKQRLMKPQQRMMNQSINQLLSFPRRDGRLVGRLHLLQALLQAGTGAAW